MSKFLRKIQKWWLFNIANPVVFVGEKGAYRYVFRRYWLEIETLSGNFKVRFTASDHPYGYLLASVQSDNEDNVIGLAERLYMTGSLLTTDQEFVTDVDKALKNIESRLEKQAATEVVEDEIEEKAAIEEVKAIQEHIELPAKERRKAERDINGRFKKAIKGA